MDWSSPVLLLALAGAAAILFAACSGFYIYTASAFYALINRDYPDQSWYAPGGPWNDGWRFNIWWPFIAFALHSADPMGKQLLFRMRVCSVLIIPLLLAMIIALGFAFTLPA